MNKKLGRINKRPTCPMSELGTSQARGELATGSHFLPPPQTNVGQLSVIDLDKAKELFKKLQADCRIPLEFDAEGCVPRAHAMAKVLEEEGVLAGKAFFEGPVRYYSSLIGEHVTALRHAGILVFIRNGSEIKPYILDPSVASNPLPIEDFQRVISGDPNLKVQFANRFQYLYNSTYQETNSHPNPKSEWSNIDGDRALTELAMYSQALTYFKEGKCNSLGNALGEIMGSDSQGLQKIKKKCGR